MYYLSSYVVFTVLVVAELVLSSLVDSLPAFLQISDNKVSDTELPTSNYESSPSFLVPQLPQLLFVGVKLRFALFGWKNSFKGFCFFENIKNNEVFRLKLLLFLTEQVILS